MLMYISKVTLKNIRGFRDLEFDLSHGPGKFAGWTVFTGDNGSGKSTILKAIAIGLTGTENARALQPSFRGWIREGAGSEQSSIELGIVRRAQDDNIKESGNKPPSQFPAKLVVEHGDKDPVLATEVPS